MASFLDTVKSAISKTGSAIKSAKDNWVAAWEEAWAKAFEYAKSTWQDTSPSVPVAISNLTNQAVERFWKSWKVAWEYVWWAIDTWLWIDSNFKWVFGWLWSATQAPQKIIEWLRSGIDTSAELVWNIQAGWSNTTSASKALKMIVDPALSIISATPIPLAVNSVMTGLGIDKKAAEWVGYLKSWLSETLQMLDVDKDTADELGSTLLDWAQVLLSIKWGQQSAKGTGSKWVQAIKDASRQAEIIKTIERKAAARPGATPESIAATVARAKETVASAKTSPVSWGEVAAHNIKAYGYDVAANTAIPVLGMAIKWVKDGDYDSITNALEAFATNAAPTLATAIPWFKWIKAMKGKQTSLNLDDAPVKIDTDWIWKDKTTEAITKEQADTIKGDIEKAVAKKKAEDEQSKQIDRTQIKAPVQEKTIKETIHGDSTQVKIDAPDIYSRQKSELQQAQDNLNRYEDYARGILATRKMPNGKKVTKKDAEFLKSEYKRLVDARDQAMRTVWPKEEVPLADNAWVMVRDKQFALPAPKTTPDKESWTIVSDTKLLPAVSNSRLEEWKIMDENFRQQYAQWKINKEAMDEYNRMANEFNQKIKAEEYASIEWNFRNNYEQQKAFQKAEAERIQAENDYNEMITNLTEGNTERDRAQEVESMKFSGITWSDIPAYLRTWEFADTTTMSEGVPVQTAMDRKLLWLEPTTPKSLLQTIQEKTGETTKTPEDLPFTATEKESAGTATAQDKFSRRMDQRKEVWATGYRIKAGENKVAATGYKNVSDDVALNNIDRVLPDGKVVDEGNYLFNSAKAVEADTQNATYESVGLTRQELSPILSWNKKVDSNDLIGKRTEYYDSEITKDNVDQYMKATFDNAKWLEWTNPNFQKGEATNIVRASALYSFIKWDPQLVAKYFTPEQVAVLSKYDKDSVVWIQQGLWDYSVTRWVFPQWMRSDGYMRLVMTPENYKDTPQTVRQEITMDIGWGQTRTFKDALDAESFVRIALARGETLTPDMAKFSSLSKEQAGASLDPYRIHWGIASMLSYGKALGEAYKSKHVATELSELGKADSTKAYMDNIRRNFFGSDLEQRILGIDTLGEWTAQKIANTIGWLGTAKAIIGNVGTYTKGWISATAKNIAEWSVSAATNALKWNFGAAMRDVGETLASIPGTLTWFARTNVGWLIGNTIDKAMGKESVGRNVQATLAKEWFITGHEVSEHIGWAMSKATWFFSSIRQENAAKTALAIRSMRRTLIDNGYKVGNAESVAKAWEQFRTEKPNEYTYARNNIYADTTLIGNVSKQARLGFLGMQRILGPIKWFATGLVWSTVNDTRNIYNEVKNGLSGKGIDIERTGWAAKRLILNTATPVLLYSTIYDALPDDMDDKARDLIAKTWQEMIWQNPIESTISWIGSLPSAIWVDAVNDLLNLTASQIDTYTKMQEWGRTKVDTMKAMAGKGLDDIRRSLAAVDYLNRASDIPGETFQEKITSALGTVNREDMTEFGTDKGSSADSTMEAIWNFLGFSIDNPMNALLRKPDKILDTTDMTIKRWLTDFLSVPKAWANADIGYQWEQAIGGYEDTISTTKEIITGKQADPLKPSSGDRVLMQQNVYDILTSIDWVKKPFSQVLSDIDIDPRMTEVIENQAGKYLVSIAKANDTVEKWLGWKFDPKKIKNDGYMQEILQDIHTKNPRAYNDFVGWLAEIRNSTKDFDYTQLKKDGKWNISFADKSADAYFDSLAAKLNESTAVQDGAIADYYDEKSLTTSAIKAWFDALGTIDSKKMTADEINKKLSEVNAYLTFIDKNSNYTGNHTNAAALETFKIAKSLVDANKLGKFIDWSKFPMLWTYVKNALDLRGEDVPRAKSIGSIVSDSGSKWVAGVAKKWFASTISQTLSSDLPTVWTDKKKDSKIKLQSGSAKKTETKWVWPVKSLAEILWVRQPQVWQQSINDLKRNQDLATFSKPMNPAKI